MKRTGTVKRFVKPIALWLIIVQTVIFFLSTTRAISGITDPHCRPLKPTPTPQIFLQIHDRAFSEAFVLGARSIFY